MKFKNYLKIGLLVLATLSLRGCLCDESDEDALQPPRLVAPGLNATIYMNNVLLEWEIINAEGTAECVILIDTTIGYGANSLDREDELDRVYDQCYYHLYNLEPGRTYYWQIEVFADNGFQTYPAWRFYTAEEFWPAGTVYNPSPDSGATATGINPELSWQCYNPDYDTFSYDIYLGTSSEPELVSVHQSDTTFDPGTLELETTYFWRVIAYNSLDEPTEGPLWHFTTTDITPGTPYNPRPQDEQEDVSLDIQLLWDVNNPDDETYSFDLYFGVSSDPAKIADNLDTTFYDLSTLEYASTYYWKVVAFSSSTDSIVGPIWTFDTVVPTLGVYAKIIFNSRLMQDIFATEEIIVRFDSSYAPDNPIDTLAADSVKVNGNLMTYSSYSGDYIYFEDPSLRWLVNGATYMFTVYGNEQVPDLSLQTEYLACSPRIISPENDSTVNTNGFNVIWDDYCTGDVILTFIQSGDTTDIWIETANDSLYEFTPDDLAPLVGHAGFYDLTIIFEQSDSIDVSGYDSRSELYMRSSHSVYLYVE